MDDKKTVSDPFRARMSDFGFIVKKPGGSSKSQKDSELQKQQSLQSP